MIADELHLAFAEAVAADLGDPDDRHTKGNGNGKVVVACALSRCCSHGPGAGAPAAAAAPQRSHREVDSKGVLYLLEKQNADTLSEEGGLHAACRGKGKHQLPRPPAG
jgi:hypothetical protein